MPRKKGPSRITPPNCLFISFTRNAESRALGQLLYELMLQEKSYRSYHSLGTELLTQAIQQRLGKGSSISEERITRIVREVMKRLD